MKELSQHPLSGDVGNALSRRTFLRIGLAGVGTLAVSPLLLACGGSSEPTPSTGGQSGSSTTTTSAPAATTASATTPTAGGDLVIGVKTTYIDVLDPNTTAQTVAHEIMGPMFDTFVYQDGDGKFWPGLASKWEISTDGLLYTFTLQNGVKFHDGTSFDGAAAKSNFDRMVAPETKSRLAGPRLIGFYDSTEVVDPTTIKVKFLQPNGSFLTDLSQDFMAMLSPAAVQKYGPDQIGQHPVGTGPFKFVEWVQNSNIKMEKNPDYNWASPMFKRNGPAYLNSINFKIIPEDGARVTALQSDQINFIDQVPTVNFVTIKNDPKYRTYAIPQPGIPYAYMLNTKRFPTDDLAVRQAINYATDKKSIIETIYQGLYTPAYGPLSPSSVAYNPEVEKMYPYDQNKAMQILEQAGWKAGSDGIRVKDGKRLEINHYTFTDTKVAEAMQAQLKKVGIDSKVTLLEVGAVNEAATRGEVTNLAPLPYRDADPAVLGVALFFKNEGKGFAWTFHKNQELDQELQLGQATSDPEQRKQHYGRAQVIAMEQALLIPVYNINGLSASLASVQDVTYDVKGVDPWVYNIWIKK